MSFLEFDGLDEMVADFKRLPEEFDEDVRYIIRDTTAYMLRRAQSEAHFRRYKVKNPKAPLTGELRRSIKRKIKSNGMVGEVEATKDYAAYVEYGTRKMRAQPYMRPAYKDAEERFQKQMKDLV